jgi:hypothetical protein
LRLNTSGSDSFECSLNVLPFVCFFAWLRLPALPIDVEHRRCLHVYEATIEGIDFVRDRVKRKVDEVKRNFCCALCVV